MDITDEKVNNDYRGNLLSVDCIGGNVASGIAPVGFPQIIGVLGAWGPGLPQLPAVLLGGGTSPENLYRILNDLVSLIKMNKEI